ncbi:MAG TPA: type IV pilus secretin PilQ [Pyrinomonadaceae bacterium]|jgi:type IV pilus assembly protein PilQ
MNSLQIVSVLARKTVIALTIISSLTIAVAAQRLPAQQQGKMYGEPGFVGEPINLKVVNADVRDILNYITEQYGVNFVIDSSVKDVPVTVNVSGVPWNYALESILRAQGLGIQVNGNILRVADSKILAAEGAIIRSQQESALDTQPLVTEFIRLNYARAANGFARGNETAGTFVNGPEQGIQAGSGDSSFSSAGASGPGSSTSGLLPIIQRRLSRRGSIEVDERSNSLIITDVRQNIEAIRQLVAILDQPEPQVEIEARIVVATRNFSRDVGVQLSGLVLGTRGSGAAGSTLPGAPVDPKLTLPGSLPTGGITNPLNSQITNTVIGLTTGVFGTAQINMLITAGEQKGQAKIIATPRVTTLNLQKAQIKSSTKIPITTVQPGSAAGGAVVATTQYVDVPLSLDITPQITDVGTIVLDVVAENASTSTIVPGVAPAINSQSMKTVVTVPDGGTTVVGGVLFDDERENTNRTPGVSNIPILGNLFKRKGVQRNSNEILFFITPRIYRPDFDTTAGKSGVTTNVTLPQPVPMGNPSSNSERKPATTIVPVGPVVQPEESQKKP